MRASWIAILVFALSIAATVGADPTTQPTTQPIAWEKWSDDVFERAHRENKFVLLDLEAVWCHWCHVMDETTYRDPKVIALIRERYIPVRVDQDSRPDLSNRYEDYGWPATVVFDGKGGEIVKRQGYIEPAAMASMLQAIIDDPTPGPSVRPPKTIRASSASSLSPEQRKAMEARFIAGFDSSAAAWGTVHKYLDWDCVEYAMNRAASGDAMAEAMARRTLAAQLKLIDPVWGGVYQYSTDGDWDHPHFEKIMQFQAEDLRAYSLAYARWHDPADLKAAQDIHRFLTSFLLGESGAFYTSQDADLVPGEHSADYFVLNDAARRQRGVPPVDRHQYARENGWAITGLASLYAATGDAAALAEARRAAEWVTANRSIERGGFRHDQADPAGPYVGDTLAMGRAFLSLYMTTGERSYLQKAEEAASFIEGHFTDRAVPGIATADVHHAGPFRPGPQLDENVMAARWANLLFRYTGRSEDRKLAETAMHYLASPDVAGSRNLLVAGILLADEELSSEPLHVTVIGPRGDAKAQSLFAAALAAPGGYKRVEWWDPAGEPLPHADVEYPRLPRPAAFVCTGSCSSPAYSPQALQKALSR